MCFYTCSSCFVEKNRLMNMWHLRYHFLCMNSCLFMLNWYELGEKWKHDPKFVKEKQTRDIEHPEHVSILIFRGLIQLCLHFYDIFPRYYTSLWEFSFLNHLISMSIKLVMIFQSWLYCWNPCFSRGAGFGSKLQNFVLEVKIEYFSLILDVFLEIIQVKSC